MKSNQSILIVIIACILVFNACKKNNTKAAPKAPEKEEEVTGPVGDPVTLSPFEIGAYLPYWGIANYQKYGYKDLTTLYIIATISKASVMSNKGLIFADDDAAATAYNQPDLTAMLKFIRQESPGIKVILSLSDMHTTSANRAESLTLFNAANRGKTIQYIMKNYVDKFGFDGVDIDIEDESLSGLGAQYSPFIKDLAASLHNAPARGKRKLCMVALNVYDFTKNVTQDVYNNVDLIGVMDYGQEKMDALKPGTPRDLMREGNDWSAKIEKSKLAFGLGFWSTHFSTDGQHAGDGWDYAKVLSTAQADTTFVPYLTTYYNNIQKPGYTLRYNGLYETRRKAEYLKKNGFKGVFGWDITKDVTDPDYTRYALLSLLKDWNENPAKYPPIVGVTLQDYYSSTQNIDGKFHDLSASSDNWVGVYELKTGLSTGYSQYLPTATSGNFTIPSTLVQSLTANKLYILRFYNGANGIGTTLLGTSHPFYKQ
ncbi:glycoside hydrolase family 18 protein [Pedobacter nyackensis]|uniref:glycoside hydrolase family 18 protein n=1 Tax=Pedobacter nyackensis TaxID=475255 RepID=UPI00292D3DEE|nr:glycoside hydrolase family 18 protein [Pedobacter nyackensis]